MGLFGNKASRPTRHRLGRLGLGGVVLMHPDSRCEYLRSGKLAPALTFRLESVHDVAQDVASMTMRRVKLIGAGGAELASAEMTIVEADALEQWLRGFGALGTK